MNRLLVLFGVLLLAAGCGGPPVPGGEEIALEVVEYMTRANPSVVIEQVAIVDTYQDADRDYHLLLHVRAVLPTYEEPVRRELIRHATYQAAGRTWRLSRLEPLPADEPFLMARSNQAWPRERHESQGILLALLLPIYVWLTAVVVLAVKDRFRDARDSRLVVPRVARMSFRPPVKALRRNQWTIAIDKE